MCRSGPVGSWASTAVGASHATTMTAAPAAMRCRLFRDMAGRQLRRFIISLTVIAGAVGALLAGVTSEAVRWLWATFLAVVSSGWAMVAAW